jgi:hypothetical protein
VAVKKKSAAKKAAPKKAVKKSSTKKAVAKKSVAKKKSAAKKVVAKKSVARKSTAKKSAAKKSAVKKRTVKKAVAKKTVSRPALAKGSVTLPPVNVSTTPAPKSAPASKPSAAPRQGSSGKTLVAVLIGVVILAVVVIANSNQESDETTAPNPVVTESAAPEATESTDADMGAEEAPAEEGSDENAEVVVTTGEAPSRFIGNWKDNSRSVMVITWRAPVGDVTGYKVELRTNMGQWRTVSEVSPTTLAAEFAKTSDEGSTSFQVSAVYADGSIGVAKAFGFAGQFE